MRARPPHHGQTPPEPHPLQVPTPKHREQLAARFEHLSALVLRGCAAALQRQCEVVIRPNDLLAEIDEAWKLGSVRPAAVSALREQVPFT